MAKARAIIKRRKAVDNIRKITRTMELIATNRFRKALEPRHRGRGVHPQDRRAGRRPGRDGQEASSSAARDAATRSSKSLLLVLTSNRGLAGGYNGNVLRLALARLPGQSDRRNRDVSLEVAGKRGIGYFRFRKLVPDATYTQFEDRPQFHEVESSGRQVHQAVRARDRSTGSTWPTPSSSRRRGRSRPCRRCCRSRPPISAQAGPSVRQSGAAAGSRAEAPGRAAEPVPYEFLPDAKSILEEIVPVSFKVRLFKCFLDAAVSEQIARMVAMGGATKNADDLVKSLTRQYNRARQIADHPRAGRHRRRCLGTQMSQLASAFPHWIDTLELIHLYPKGFMQHGHRDDDRTHFPGDRLDLRRRVRRRASARTSTTRSRSRARSRGSRSN